MKFYTLNGLSQGQARKRIHEAQTEFSRVASEALKIQLLQPLEQELIEKAMEEEFVNQAGNYDARYRRLVKNYMMVCGILYNHLSVKQIDYGSPIFQTRYDELLPPDIVSDVAF